MGSGLSILSFFVGGVLLLLVFASLLDPKKELKSSKFFLATLAIAGVQRVVFGMVDLELLSPSLSTFYRPLSFVYFVPVIYHFFFDALYQQEASRRKLYFHFGLATVIAILSMWMNWNSTWHQVVFLIYSSIYFVGLAYLVWTYSTKQKSQRELQYFKTIQVWGYLMFGTFTLIYGFSNFTYLHNEEGLQNELLGEFYGLTSFLWLFICFYLLRNPRILYGEQRLLDQIQRVVPEEIAIWRIKKKGQTSTQDLPVEKLVATRLDSLIFSLKKLEQGWREELLEVPSIKTLAFQLDCPQSHLKFIFKHYSNFTFGEYVNVLKVNYAISLIRKGYLEKHTIGSLAKKVLFNSDYTFYLNFKKLTGESPSEFHAQLLGEKIKSGNFFESGGS